MDDVDSCNVAGEDFVPIMSHSFLGKIRLGNVLNEDSVIGWVLRRTISSPGSAIVYKLTLQKKAGGDGNDEFYGKCEPETPRIIAAEICERKLADTYSATRVVLWQVLIGACEVDGKNKDTGQREEQEQVNHHAKIAKEEGCVKSVRVNNFLKVNTTHGSEPSERTIRGSARVRHAMAKIVELSSARVEGAPSFKDGGDTPPQQQVKNEH